jgi:hypothetical protein
VTRETFTFMSFVWRWLAALALIFATFNPAGFSFFHWITPLDGGQLPFKVVAGVALAVGYIVFFRATWRSIGPIGLTLVLAFFAAVIWALVDQGLLDPGNATIMAYVILVIFATVLAIGMSWSHVRRQLSGQADVMDGDG